MVYDPSNMETEITLTVLQGAEIYSTSIRTVDRTRQTWSTRDYPVGQVTFTITYGNVKKSHTITVVENDIKIEDDEPKLVFTTSLDKAPAVFEDLCATEFGYHMIVVNDYEEAEKTESLEKDDTNGYQKDIEVLINEKEANNTDDNIYVIVENTYNTETTKANINQLFVFYVQKQTGATSTLDSDVEEVLKAMFNDSISRYLSTGFQNFLLYKDLNAVVEYAPLATYYANYKGYLERSSQSYDVKDDFISWYADDMNWARPYNVK
jgi:hypothetical protein